MISYAVRRVARALATAAVLWVALALYATAGSGVPFTMPLAWLARLDIRTTFATDAVRAAIGSAIAPTALLIGCASLMTLLLGWGGGLALATVGHVYAQRDTPQQGRPPYRIRATLALGRVASGALQVGQGLPVFWLGGLLVAVCSIGLGWLPPGGIVSPNLPAFGGSAYGTAVQAQPLTILGDLLAHLLLPALTLALAGLATPLRLIRAVVPRELQAPHGQVARGAGLAQRRLLWRAVRPTIPLVIGATSAELPLLASALVLVEYLFGWPGLGLLAYHAARAGDWALLETLALLVGFASIAAGTVADLVAAWADPRLRGAPDAA